MSIIVKRKIGTIFLLTAVSALIVLAGSYVSAQESGAIIDDETVSEGYEVIKNARENKPTPEGEDAQATVEETGSETDDQPKPESDTTPDPQKERAESIRAKAAPPYDSTGKRDPFKPFLKLVATSTAPSPVIRPPLQRYPLDQYRISGIVWIGSEPKAMVVDPEANTYFLGVGDKIGNQDGEILEVRDNGLLVQEKTRYENVYGEAKIEVKKSVLAFQNEEN